jgi:hypothetical protein
LRRRKAKLGEFADPSPMAPPNRGRVQMNRFSAAVGFATAVALILPIVGCMTTIDGGARIGHGLCDTPQLHCINVYVVGGQIELDVPDLYVVGPRGQSHTIYWQIDPASGAGYAFPPQGIAGLPGAPNGDFPTCNPLGSGSTLFSCVDLNKTATTYKYTITLTGPQQLSRDPTIKNG